MLFQEYTEDLGIYPLQVKLYYVENVFPIPVFLLCEKCIRQLG